MLYNLINGAAILAGGIIGMLIGKILPEKMSNTLLKAIALGVMFIGISTMLTDANPLIVLLCLTLGVIIGELLKIEDGINYLGTVVENRMNRNKDDNYSNPHKANINNQISVDTANIKSSERGSDEQSNVNKTLTMNVAQGFVSATILFCSGGMAIVGSLQAGLTGDGATLLAKSILDGVVAMIYATTMGFGVLLSTIPVILYQGIFVLLASSLTGLLSTAAIVLISTVGGIIILGIGINLMFETKIRIGSFIPAVFIPILLSALKLI